MHLLLGGPIIGGDALEPVLRAARVRHPGTAPAVLGRASLAGVKRGVSVPPVPGQIVDPKTYDAEYEKELKTGVPFFGDAMLKDALFSALAVIVVVVVAAIVGPKGPDRPARSDAERRESAARMALSVAVRTVVAQPAGCGDVHHPGLSVS